MNKHSQHIQLISTLFSNFKTYFQRRKIANENDNQGVKLGIELITTLLVIIGTQSIGLAEKSAKEISKIAQQVTVQINPNIEELPGGSGVIIAKKGNLYIVLTANHVVCENVPRSTQIECRSDLNYTIRTPDGQNHNITQMELFPKTTNDPDLAIVVFESSQNFPVADLGNSNKSGIGSEVFVAGFPALFGKTGSNRALTLVQGAVVQRLQENQNGGYSLVYDANTQTGISGGPVFNDNGQLVGIHGLGDTSGVNQSKTGFNAAIPINTFKEICAKNTNCSQMKFAVTSSQDHNTDNQKNLDNPQSGRDYYKKAVVSQGREETQEALKNYDQALQNNLDESTAFLTYLNRGMIYSDQKNWSVALEDFNQAIAINPNSPKSYTERANVFMELGNTEEALEDFNKAISLDPFYGPAYNDRAFIYNRQRDFFHAALDLKKAADLMLSQGKIINYITVVENQKIIENQDLNLRLLNRWGYTLAPCSSENISIFFDQKEYCILPVQSLNQKKYKYNRYKDTFEVLSAENDPSSVPPMESPQNSTDNSNLALIKDWQLTVTPCSNQTVTIFINNQKYCTLPSDWLTIGTYKYIPSENRLEPIESISSVESRPGELQVDTSNSATTDTGDIEGIIKQFTFYSLWDYGNCLEDILQLYQGVDNLKQRGRKSNCLPAIFATYGETGLTQQQAVELVHAANVYATTVLYRKFYPLQGQRTRIREMFGYVYDIDQK